MSLIRNLASQVRKLEPGQRITFDRHLINEARPMPMVGILGPMWSPADQIMEAIIGSAYEFRYFEEPMTRNVTFERLEKPLQDGRHSYVSPDRRDRVTLGTDGFYHTTT